MEALYTTSRRLAGEQISVPGYVYCCLSLAKPESDFSSQQKCALRIHGYTERIDPRATYSSPSIVGGAHGRRNHW